MPIPNAHLAFVPPEKLEDYLLNPAHPIGGPKAVWFMSIGYSRSDPERLATNLLEIARSDSPYVEQRTSFGIKYVVTGEIRASNSVTVTVLTVWIAERDGQPPRLVTAYPQEE